MKTFSVIPSDFIGSVSTVSNMRLIYIWIYLVQSEDQSVVFLTASSCVSLYADDLIVSTCVSLAPPPFSLYKNQLLHSRHCLSVWMFEPHVVVFSAACFLDSVLNFFFLFLDVWHLKTFCFSPPGSTSVLLILVFVHMFFTHFIHVTLS